MSRLVFLVALIACGCTVVGATRNGSSKTTQKKTADERAALGEAMKGYADSYVTLIGSACSRIVEGNPDIKQRRAALRFRSLAATAVYDIATNPDSFTQLVDMLLVVSLQNGVWIDDARADDHFGDRGEHLVSALRRSREDIWELAQSVLSSEQLSVMDSLIWDWRERHPEVHFVSLVRFTDFADSRGKSLVDDAHTHFMSLGSVDDAVNEAQQLRALAERMFYIGKRAPLMMEWELQLAQTEMLAQPEVHELLQNQDRMFDSIDRITTQVEALPKFFTSERVAVVKAVEEQGTQLATIATEYRALVSESRKLATEVQASIGDSTVLLKQLAVSAAALEKTTLAVDHLVGRFLPEPGAAVAESDSEPFQIGDYTAALMELTTALTEANTLVDRADGLMDDERLNRAIDRVEQSAREVGSIGFWRALTLILSFFGALALYQTYSVVLRARFRGGS